MNRYEENAHRRAVEEMQERTWGQGATRRNWDSHATYEPQEPMTEAEYEQELQDIIKMEAWMQEQQAKRFAKLRTKNQ